MTYPDLSNAVESAFANIVASGAIEKAIEAQLEKTVTAVINNNLERYGDFGKKLAEKVGAAMDIDVERMDLPSYAHFIEKIIARTVDAQLTGDVARKIEAHMAALLADAPTEITLDRLVEDFKQHVKDRAYGGDIDHEITLHVEEASYGYWYVAMDKDHSVEKYRCAFRMGVNEQGEIYSLSIGKEDVNKELFIHPARGFERDLYRMFVSGTIVRIEPGTSHHDFNLSMHDD
ncbi:hypothetical protein [Paraburkholderia sp. J10-1]|uniref:hypothetical protein n=1 Tax=Paraburkholderia sp. J10-1 TaxID=2805430 RepID=UPI002AB6555C|nr:hypothetical protein [Paraburkholderia sp. J10-1]